MQIGIIGHGMVGGALSQWLKEQTLHQIKIYDPALGFEDDISLCPVVFIAVPVPTAPEGQDQTILKSSIEKCGKDSVIFVRSTVLPGTCDSLAKEFNRCICHAPEFLTERQRHEDMLIMDVFLGYPEGREGIVSSAGRNIFRGKKKVFTRPNRACELGKYIHNCYGAMKVTFFNMASRICKEQGINFRQMMDVVYLSGHVDKQHTLVPGPDGYYGYGGTCFPKDMEAFSRSLWVHHERHWIEQCMFLNSEYRKET